MCDCFLSRLEFKEGSLLGVTPSNKSLVPSEEPIDSKPEGKNLRRNDKPTAEKTMRHLGGFNHMYL
jgi:hypothetical protein